MTLLGRDVVEVDALVTDRYLDSLLAAGEQPQGPDDGRGRQPRRRPWFLAGMRRGLDPEVLDEGVRLASERLTRDLPRFHPSFRFEERLAVRLAEAAASMRLPIAAGGEDISNSTATPQRIRDLDVDPLDDLDALATVGSGPRPLLVGGAVAASALSLAGAAWMAWRRSRPTGSPMARAARAAHASNRRSTSSMRGRPA